MVLNTYMKYCTECLMPDTRPGIRFENGICIACIHYKKQKTINWDKRLDELKKYVINIEDVMEMDMIVP